MQRFSFSCCNSNPKSSLTASFYLVAGLGATEASFRVDLLIIPSDTKLRLELITTAFSLSKALSLFAQSTFGFTLVLYR